MNQVVRQSVMDAGREAVEPLTVKDTPRPWLESEWNASTTTVKRFSLRGNASMAPLTGLTMNQLTLLEQLYRYGRIIRGPEGCHLENPFQPRTALTEETFQALLKADCLVLTENLGIDRSVYVSSSMAERLLRESGLR